MKVLAFVVLLAASSPAAGHDIIGQALITPMRARKK
jgi:hypothetical protein